ncbi:ribonuclease P protein component [Spirochaeta cellobiosiphila]|uniref:ribonuclease P protein component n=1 Tax=Spirochaeta cellobiosiphila TaxID=504483 RepID=UPI00041A5FBB|nr:ribonuclease P protein component [Spirochaeta cellobiosiphila]
MRRNLTKSERIKKQKDIRGMFKHAHSVSIKGAKLFFKRNDLAQSRFTVTLVRKYGKAVHRNRAKRVVREIYRLNKNQIKCGFDLVFMLFPSNNDIYSERKSQIIELLRKAEIFEDNIITD